MVQLVRLWSCGDVYSETHSMYVSASTLRENNIFEINMTWYFYFSTHTLLNSRIRYNGRDGKLKSE